MARKDSERWVRLGLATAASGLGYVYHALSQERSLGSKIREDTHRLKNELQRKESSESIKRQINNRLQAAKQTSDLLQCPYADLISSEVYTNGEVHWINYDYLQAESDILVYFHGGQRIDTLSQREWEFLGQVVGENTFPILIVPIQSLSIRSFDLEVQTLYGLLKEVTQKHPDKQLTALSYDSGVLLALDLASANCNLLKKIISISPWFNETATTFAIVPNDYVTNKEEYMMIQGLWQRDATAPKIDQIEWTRLPEVVFIIGSYDSLKTNVYRLYKRLLAHNKPTKCYQFDRMVHDFVLTRLPEAKEAVGLIRKEFKEE